MIPELTLDELEKWEAKNDATVMFHGTSSCHCKMIEEHGWQFDSRPYDWEDVKFLLDVTEEIVPGNIPDLYLYVNYKTQPGKNKGAYFTYLLKGAIQYAGATGGETVRCTLKGAKRVLALLESRDGYEAERVRTQSIIASLEPLVFSSVPVVYVVRGDEGTFPDVLPQQITAFQWQIENRGKVSSKPGDFRSGAAVPASAILGKAILDKAHIEKL
jgi:hypothetical protein